MRGVHHVTCLSPSEQALAGATAAALPEHLGASTRLEVM